MLEIKECPFCGVIPVLALPELFGKRIIHPENGCFIAKRSPGVLGEAYLLEEWNKRAEQKTRSRFSELRSHMSEGAQQRADERTRIMLQEIDSQETCKHVWFPIGTAGVGCQCGKVLPNWPSVQDYENWKRSQGDEHTR